jgi:uncharacterized protein YbjT (DUF2867 family)
MRTALIIGATGLIGKACLYQLLESSEYSKVIAIVRRPIAIKHSKLHFVIVDFDNLEQYQEEIVAEDIYCCMGTTIKDAGSQLNFRKVDYNYPLLLAKIALQNGAAQFLLVSAIGAAKHSTVFYNKIKGELEESITSMGYPTVKIFQPSLLLGDRKQFRLGETIAKAFMRLFDFLFIIGPLRNYRAVEGKTVARAMVYAALNGAKGNVVYTNFEIHGMGHAVTHEPDLPFGEKPLFPSWRTIRRLIRRS